MANAAFWLGLMVGVHDKYGDITQRMDFDVAKNNFLKASVHGLDTKLFWIDNKSYAAGDLILHELLPLAKAGLKKQKVNNAEIKEYLGIIEERVQKVRTGSYWQLKSFNKLVKTATKEEVLAAITASTIQNQKNNIPVHNWKLAELDDNKDWKPSDVFVEEFMTTKVFTAKQEDIVELVSEMMDWQKIRYVAVENKKGKLVGLATSRMMLRAYMKHIHQKEKLPLSVGEVMIKDPMTISPRAKFSEAMDIMTKYQFGCLPVVDDKNNLVGMVTEANFLVISKNLFDKIK
jgi:CBS domain-containing protein